MENTYTIKAKKYTGNRSEIEDLAVLSASFAWILTVTPAELGTEKQIEYANSLKLEAISTIEKQTARMISSGKYQADMVIALRNRTMDAVDADLDATHIINTLKSASRDFQGIVLAYNVKIA
jgi:hypothetical protein